MIKTSVIVPVYNVEKYLSKCIDSILSQSFREFELILVDDGSTDNSGKICDEYLQRDSRVIVIHKTNTGVSSARNTGISAAKGRYITFVDSDDYLDKDFLSNAITKIEEENADLYISGIQMETYCNEVCVDTKSYTFSHNMVCDVCRLLVRENIDYPTICISGPCCKLYRRDIIIEKEILFDISISLGEDCIFNLDYLASINKIYCDTEIFYYYRRENANSLYSRFNSEIFKINEKIINRKIELCEQVGINEKYILALQHEFVNNVIGSIIHFYIHNASKTQKFTLFQDLSRHSLIKNTKKHSLSLKERTIFALLKYKLFHLIHIILTIKYFYFYF